MLHFRQGGNRRLSCKTHICRKRSRAANPCISLIVSGRCAMREFFGLFDFCENGYQGSFPETEKAASATTAISRSQREKPRFSPTEGLGSRNPQQEWQQEENPEMEFSYSVAVSCSKNVASRSLTKIDRENILSLTPFFLLAFASNIEKVFFEVLAKHPSEIVVIEGG